MIFVSGRSARRIASGSTTPRPSTGNLRDRSALRQLAPSTAGCSMRRRNRVAAVCAIPRSARLSASVPPLVNTISFSRRAQHRRYLPPRFVQLLPRRLPEIMDTGSVAVHFGHHRQHRLQNFGGNRRRRVVIEIMSLARASLISILDHADLSHSPPISEPPTISWAP